MTEDLNPIAYLLAAVLTLLYFTFFPGPQIVFDSHAGAPEFSIYRSP